MSKPAASSSANSLGDHPPRSNDVARRYVEMTGAFNDGTVASLEGRTAATRTPTRFEDFVDDLVRVHRVA